MFKLLTKQFSVAAQLSLLDMEQAVKQGFKVIINNRPDNEEADQPHSSEFAALAKKLAITYYYCERPAKHT